ncbi:MAG: alpha-glucosidase [Anaerolineales bacterium]|nr:alpha-glucosidase [Anaerolineales bacterium]
MKRSNQPWWKEAVFYHIYVRSFSDSNGDGLGDLPGLISRLDYLKGGEDSLGIDALWLSPVYPSPDADFGYDIADYCNIDPRYGTMQDFDRLVESAHQRGIRILMDLVFNHTSDQHPWFLESRSTRNNPKRDWYIWHDPKRGRKPPNNWASIFGGGAWEFDPATSQYYLHMFVKQQPDLNWRNPDVPAALMDVVRFWIDRGVDGFRLDVFNMWYKHPDLPNNPPAFGIRPFDRQKHVNDMDQPEMFSALKSFRAILDSSREKTSVGELFGHDPDLAAAYCGKDKLHMVFNFEFSDCRFSPAAFRNAIQRWEASLGEDQWPCYVLSNHDLNRHITRYAKHPPNAVARITATLLLTLRGTPFIYYGEEIGLPDTRLERSQIVDPPGQRYWPLYKGRDSARCPLPWDSSPNGGFTSGQPWLPLYSNFQQHNVALQQSSPDSVFAFYRRMIQLRKEIPALTQGRYRSLNDSATAGMVYLRETETQQALIGLNFSNKRVYLNSSETLGPESWFQIISSCTDTSASIAAGGIYLNPYEAVVWVRER